MSAVELVMSIVAVSCALVSLTAAVLASRHYSVRGRKHEAKRMAERRSAAVGQLQEWREEGILIVQDEALEAALYWEKADPDILLRLVHTIRTFLEEKDVKPGTGDTLVLAMAHDAKENEAGEREVPRRKLKLIAGFG